jgi:tetratricopeptide (TPR) repeat protein
MPEGKPVEEVTAHATIDSDLKDIFHEFKKGIEEELGEQDSETRYNLGIAYKEMGLLEDAIREFKIVAKDPKKILQSSSMLALCYMDKKLYPLAIQEFKKITEVMVPTDDSYLGARCDLADAYVKNSDYNKSLKLYTEIYAQDPKFRDVARKVEIIKKLVSEGKDEPKSKKDRVSYI